LDVIQGRTRTHKGEAHELATRSYRAAFGFDSRAKDIGEQIHNF